MHMISMKTLTITKFPLGAACALPWLISNGMDIPTCALDALATLLATTVVLASISTQNFVALESMIA